MKNYIIATVLVVLCLFGTTLADTIVDSTKAAGEPTPAEQTPAPQAPAQPPADLTAFLKLYAWSSPDVLCAEVENEKDHTLMLFLVDWCGYCKRLKNTTLLDSSFVKFVNDNFNVVLVNPDKDTLPTCITGVLDTKTFARSMGVKGWPGSLVFDGDGKPLGKVVGAKSSQAYLASLDNILHPKPKVADTTTAGN